MKNHYDKIFLFVAFVVLALSAGIFFVGNSGLDTFSKKTNALKNAGAQGDEWEVKELKKTRKSLMKDWQFPASQDDKGDWVFQVFTPPIIWEDADGKLVTTPPVVEIVVEEEEKYAVCELELAEVTGAEYPVRLLGYMGSANPIFEFRDSVKGIVFSGKKDQALTYKDPKDITGKTIVDLGLKVVSFNKERVKREDNSMADLMIVGLEDKAMDKVVELRGNAPTILLEERKMKIISNNGDGFESFVSKVGDEIDYNGSKYKLTELSFDDAFVVFEQVPADSKILPTTSTLTIRKKSEKRSRSDEYDDEYLDEYSDDEEDSQNSRRSRSSRSNDDEYDDGDEVDNGVAPLVDPGLPSSARFNKSEAFYKAHPEASPNHVGGI